MSFGENILKKFGWKEGDGLGKNSTGITAPIKAHRKSNNSGLGASLATEVSGGHWWERVFNDAANNLQVESTDGEVKVKQKDSDGVEISSKSYSMKKLLDKKDVTYGAFLKAATLDVGKETEVENRTKIEDIQHEPVKVLSDAELFKACGGLTAHKGARHGLKLTGKLNRVEEQDRLLLAKMGDWQQVKQKKKAISPNQSSESDEDELKPILSLADYKVNSKKKKSNTNKLSQELAEKIEKAFNSITPAVVSTSNPELEKISKSSKAISKKSKKKKKKKAKSKDYLTQQALDMIQDDDEMTLVKVKKSKKKDSEEAPKVREDFLKKKPASPCKKRKITALQSASSESEDTDIDKINEEASHLRHKRKIRREEVCDSEFQKLHKEVAQEKGVEFKEYSKNKWKKIKAKVNKTAKKLDSAFQ